jgi:hypothetical protein
MGTSELALGDLMVSHELLRQLAKGRGVDLVLRLQAWSKPSHLDHETSIPRCI